MSDTPPELGGGQIWKQSRFPFYTCYIAFLCNDTWAQMSDPRQHGSISWSRENHDSDLWHADELHAHLITLGYVCQGQLSNLIDEAEERAWDWAVDYGSLSARLGQLWGRIYGYPPRLRRRWRNRRRT